MEKAEWSKAQEIIFSVDLVGAAKQELRFLEAVDNVGCLYDGSTLNRAIYRYKNCWLPLLAKNMKSSMLEGPLVVPLDCEWIWHCHRLNPIQYKRDCEEIYGRVLGKLNVLSSTEGACSEKTESLWNRIYVCEPYNFNLVNTKSPETTIETNTKSQSSINYDLVAAVKRQSSFFRKVAKMMNYGDSFLEEAVSKYKAFHHLIQIIRERKLQSFCVPTHDIDLIWHTHQLDSVAYGKDMKAIHGRVVDHDDRDSEPRKMEYRFSQTKELWGEIFGTMCHVSGVVPKNTVGASEKASCTYMCEVDVHSKGASCTYMCEVGVDSKGATCTYMCEVGVDSKGSSCTYMCEVGVDSKGASCTYMCEGGSCTYMCEVGVNGCAKATNRSESEASTGLFSAVTC